MGLKMSSLLPLPDTPDCSFALSLWACIAIAACVEVWLLAVLLTDLLESLLLLLFRVLSMIESRRDMFLSMMWLLFVLMLLLAAVVEVLCWATAIPTGMLDAVLLTKELLFVPLVALLGNAIPIMGGGFTIQGSLSGCLSSAGSDASGDVTVSSVFVITVCVVVVLLNIGQLLGGCRALCWLVEVVYAPLCE